MRRTCKKCNTSYDDARSSTICPHNQLMSDEDLDRKEAAFKLLGKKVRFAHQKDSGPDFRVQAISWNGMIELAGMSGEFAPHVFVVVGGESC